MLLSWWTFCCFVWCVDLLECVCTWKGFFSIKVQRVSRRESKELWYQFHFGMLLMGHLTHVPIFRKREYYYCRRAMISCSGANCQKWYFIGIHHNRGAIWLKMFHELDLRNPEKIKIQGSQSSSRFIFFSFKILLAQTTGLGVPFIHN